jgi:hypothetical protein
LATRLDASGIFAQSLATPVVDIASLPQSAFSSSKTALVLLVTTASLQQRSLRVLVQSLRSRGMCAFLVLLDGPTEVPVASPPGLRQTPTLRLEQDFEQLTRLLQGQYPAGRVPYLAPPPPAVFMGRELELSRLKSMLLGPALRNTRVAIVGLGGTGKSSLARTLCDDNDILDAFVDGVLWVAADSAANLQVGLAKWVAAFEAESAVVPDVDETERRLATHLANKSCLLVFDDLQDSTLLQRILHGPNCSVLMTTRILEVALACRAQVVDIGALTHEAAVRLTLSSLQSEEGQLEAMQDTSALDELVTQLGDSPVAIQLASKLLLSRAAAGQDLNEAARELAEGLRTEGLDALGEDWQSRIGGFSAAIERLPAADRLQLKNLAVLPPGQPVPLQGAGNEFSLTPEMAQRLASLSLVEFDSATQTITIPSLTHAFLRTVLRREEQANVTRLAGRIPTGVKIFISYRRENTLQARRISDRLSREYGPSSVFRDAERVLPGEDWKKVIRDALAVTNVVLILIGRDWSNDRLRDPQGLMHLQIRHALERGVSVIPVLLDGVEMPRGSQLPDDIEALSSRSPLELDETRGGYFPARPRERATTECS